MIKQNFHYLMFVAIVLVNVTANASPPLPGNEPPAIVQKDYYATTTDPQKKSIMEAAKQSVLAANPDAKFKEVFLSTNANGESRICMTFDTISTFDGKMWTDNVAQNIGDSYTEPMRRHSEYAMQEWTPWCTR